jgi:hypothetical protein
VAADNGLGVRFECHDLLSWAPPAAAFDLVTMVYMQVPAPGMEVAVGNAATAVAPGGTLLVVGHHLDNLSDGVGGPQSPDVLYTEVDLRRWSGGLQVEEARRVERPVEEGVAIDALLIARR